jgi:hypothetical protein
MNRRRENAKLLAIVGLLKGIAVRSEMLSSRQGRSSAWKRIRGSRCSCLSHGHIASVAVSYPSETEENKLQELRIRSKTVETAAVIAASTVRALVTFDQPGGNSWGTTDDLIAAPAYSILSHPRGPCQAVVERQRVNSMTSFVSGKEGDGARKVALPAATLAIRSHRNWWLFSGILGRDDAIA